jgi:hypothetical protein
MPEIRFELTLPDGPNSSFVAVAGGADANHDGSIQEPNEVGAFARSGNVWGHKQIIADPVSGTAFSVVFAVGGDVRWTFTVHDGGGKELFSDSGRTVFNVSEIWGKLA